MKLPLFYHPDLKQGERSVTLDEPTSKHIIQVLRMQTGKQLQLTNGEGVLWTMEIVDDNRKKAIVKVLSETSEERPPRKISIAISPVKNSSRFEWFLEKATEIGVSEIITVTCARTEKLQFKHDRLQSILVSAMLQSQQVWLPRLHEPVKLEKLLETFKEDFKLQKLIAHCEEDSIKQTLPQVLKNNDDPRIILIGPEGDFTPAEIKNALESGFIPVSLGHTRLRTETAGIAAATLLANI